MRYAIALMLMLLWVGVQFVSAQENKFCPPSSLDQGQTDTDLSDETYSKGNVETESEFESETEGDAELKQDYEYEMDTDQSRNGESDIMIEGDQSKENLECPDTDMGSTNYYYEGDTEVSVEPSTVIVTEEAEVEKDRSTLGKIWRAPFKLIGNIPAAVVSVVSETAEGAGHIVGAPFKGVGKLFGAGDGDRDGVDIEDDNDLVEIDVDDDAVDVDVDRDNM
jgi:hypothetical protein